MIKKFAAILACLLALTMCVGAVAETVKLPENTNRFDITLTLPEGATLLSTEQSGEYTQSRVQKSGLADVVIGLAPSEEYAERSMNDFSADEIELLKTVAGEQYNNPLFEVETTPSGNSYLHMCSNEANDIDSIFTVYKGYFVELTQQHEDFRALTEADNAFMLDLLHGIEFVDVP